MLDDEKLREALQQSLNCDASCQEVTLAKVAGIKLPCPSMCVCTDIHMLHDLRRKDAEKYWLKLIVHLMYFSWFLILRKWLCGSFTYYKYHIFHGFNFPQMSFISQKLIPHKTYHYTILYSLFLMCRVRS